MLQSKLPLSTGFDLDFHGFNFSNDNIQYEILHSGGLSGYNLCGGMVYSVLDNFLNGRTIPNDLNPPGKGTPLNSYIYSRQKDAHYKTVPRFVVGINWFVDSVASEYDKLRKQLDKRPAVPVPLFLVKEGMFHGHHVLIIGGQSSPSSANPILDVYDPNYPLVITKIHAEHIAKRFALKNSRGESLGYLKGFFVDTGYEKQMPPW
jgi:hypothetical protein